MYKKIIILFFILLCIFIQGAEAADEITEVASPSISPDLLIRDINIEQNGQTENFQLGPVLITINFKNTSEGTYLGKLNTKNNFNNFQDTLVIDNDGDVVVRVYHPEGNYELKGLDDFNEYYSAYLLKPGSITLEAEVDSSNLVTESNETNNKFSKTITISDPNNYYVAPKIQVSIKEENTISITNDGMYSHLKGKIILKVENFGKAYYVHPQLKEMYYLGRPADAFSVMRNQGVGITNTDLNKIPAGLENLSGSDSDADGLSDLFEDAIGTDKNNTDSDDDGFSDKDELNGDYSPTEKNVQLSYDNNFSLKQNGKILLQVERNGEAWYIYPNNDKRYFLGRPADAFQVMRNLGLGISNADFDKMSE